MDNYFNRLNLTKDNYLNIICYIEETFKEIYKTNDTDDYIKTLFSSNYPFSAIEFAKEKYNAKVDGARFVIIDDEFLTWCNNEDKELNCASVNEYASSLNDFTAKRLWSKHNKDYDLVLCSIPIIVKYIYEKTKYSRYYHFDKETLEKARDFLAKILNFSKEDIFIYEDALTNTDAINNIPIIEDYFRSSILGENNSINLVKSIFNGYEEDSFTLKYIICGIKVTRNFKMTIEEALFDHNIEIDKLLVKDEMAYFSEVLTSNNNMYTIYPVFDRLIKAKDIESSNEMLKKFLPQLLSSG